MHVSLCWQATRANLDCSFFDTFPLFNGVTGSASCLRYDALWYAVSDTPASWQMVWRLACELHNVQDCLHARTCEVHTLMFTVSPSLKAKLVAGGILSAC